MGILFGSKKMFSAKQLKWSKAKNSPVMKEILRNKDSARALDKSSERNELYSAIKSRAKDGVTVQEMREVVGHFIQGKGKSIGRKEARAFSEGIMKGQNKKYTYKNTDISMEKSSPKTADPNPAAAPAGRVYGQKTAPLETPAPANRVNNSVRVIPPKTSMRSISPSFTKKF